MVIAVRYSARDCCAGNECAGCVVDDGKLVRTGAPTTEAFVAFREAERQADAAAVPKLADIIRAAVDTTAQPALH